MKIIIDFRNTYKGQQALRTFTYEFWRDITLLHPSHDFIFLTNINKGLENPGNNSNWQFLRKTNIQWLDKLRLQKRMLKERAERLVTIPSHDFSATIDHLNAAGKKMIVQRSCQLLFAGNTGLKNAIFVQPALAGTIQSLTWAETESIKTQYTGGRSFFLFTGDIGEQHQLVELLKAFSTFKKWQQSNMQLLMAGSTTTWTEILLKNTSTAVTAKLAAACYAMVYPAAENIFPLALLWALQSNKAVIASSTGVNTQFTTAAAWVAPGQTAEGFAKAMILLYKDEARQQQLVQQTKEQSSLYNRQLMLDTVWHHIDQ